MYGMIIGNRVRKLPNRDTAHLVVLERHRGRHRVELRLVRLAPLDIARVVRPLRNCTSARLGDDEGLAVLAVNLLCEVHPLPAHILPLSNGAVPARVVVEGDDVGMVEAFILHARRGGPRDEARRVAVSRSVGALAVRPAGFARVALTLVKESPQNDRRVIHGRRDHLIDGCDVRAHIRLTLQLRSGVRRRPERLFPHHNPVLVAKVEKRLILRVVRAPNKICTRLLEQAHILLEHGSVGGG
mmetsp:Transcript_16660/g.54431  ORF Transcript_16660/g.54431 Transcript_16660/m.54431 type:complete len:242 (-) Transcript_16660:306-1031(-)